MRRHEVLPAAVSGLAVAIAACGGSSPAGPSRTDLGATLRLASGTYTFQVAPADAPGAGWLCMGTGDGTLSPASGAAVPLRIESSGPAAWTGRPLAGDALDDFLLTLAATDPRGNGLEGVVRGSAAALVPGVRLAVGPSPPASEARLSGRIVAVDRAEGTIQGELVFRSAGTTCTATSPYRWVLARL